MKAILILFLSALSCVAQMPFARGIMNQAAPVAVSPCDSCTGNLLFSWHCENANVTLGTPCGCSVGDTIAALASACVVTNSPAEDGSSSIAFPTSNDYATFDWDSSTSPIVSTAAGTLDFWIYFNSIPGGVPIDIYVDGNNKIQLNMDASNKYFTLWHVAGGTSSSGRTTYPAFNVGAWYHVKARWDHTAHSGLYIKVTCDTTTGEANSQDNGTSALGTWAGTTGTVKFGDSQGYGGVYFMDNIKIYNNWQ